MMPDLFDLEDLSAGVAETVRRIAIAGFHALWDGSTPTLCELNGGDGGAALDEAVAHLRRRPTRHRIEHRGGSVNTWCALDAIGIPAALGIDARAVTTCPSCNRELIVTLASGSAVPLVGVVLWYPETADAWEHLVDQFCSGANLFCNFDHLQDRMGTEGAGGAIMTVEEVAEIGREAWADVSTTGKSR
jgi:hypothetical protein